MRNRRINTYDSILDLIGRENGLFNQDLTAHENELRDLVHNSRFLVIGGAGSIGQAVVKEIFKRGPSALHVIDLSENNLVELVRDIRSSLGYFEGDFKTLPLDCGSAEFDAFISSEKTYQYIINLSALKHVRSEKDPYTLMRMIRVNILNSEKLAVQASRNKSLKFFCVSTDKAANPENMMGASKRIMEMFVLDARRQVPVSLARFANVAFSDGSLPFGFTQRIMKRQPIAAPRDVRRYFITSQESGILCLLSCLLGENRDLFFPKLDERLHLISFDRVAKSFLEQQGYDPVECSSEDEARQRMAELLRKGCWPCFFFESDTTGEKAIEEFYTEDEIIDLRRFYSVGIVKNTAYQGSANLDDFRNAINVMVERGSWTKDEIKEQFIKLLPDFSHRELNKSLDEKM